MAKRKKARKTSTSTRKRKRAKRVAVVKPVEPTKPPLRKVVLQMRTPPGPGYKLFCQLARKLPGVEESTSYGTPSLRVKGRILGRLRTEAEGALALRIDLLDRQILLQADPDTFFLTEHYINYPMVLVRLDHMRRKAMQDLLLRSWRLVAPAKLIAAYDAVAKR